MNKTCIIAEAGVNHNNDINKAKQMIEIAKWAGADIIKFQTFKADSLVSRFAKKAEYQTHTTNPNESQYDMIKALELSYESHLELISYCNKLDIQFLSTPFDLESIKLLQDLDVNMWKIPSGELTNLPYLLEIGKTKKPVILSTGMSNLGEIEQALDLLKSSGTTDITLLHCNTEYPTPFKDVNLNAMLTLRDKFKVKVGYSDHTIGIEIPIAAVAMGAQVIEKHFTLDRNMEGPDHKASLEPNELKLMIDGIRNIEEALGNGIKTPSDSEKKNIEIARKSIVAKINIKKDEIFTEENITTKRPANGLSPMKWFEVLGKTAIKDFKEDELIEI